MTAIKTEKEIEIMKEGGGILARIILQLEKMVKPGIAANDIDKVAEDLVLKSGAKCSFKGYNNFPACLCTSINNVIVHGIPSERVLREGDILSLDLGIKYKGFHTDMAVTVPVGNKISAEAERLITITKNSLEVGIKHTGAGMTFGDIGNAVQEYVEKNGFNVVRELCGHGIGKNLHEDPQVLNFGQSGKGIPIKEGMVFCIEPMVTMGDWKIKKGKDGFSYETVDGSLAAHFEHTIAITKDGCKVLTNYEN